MSAGGSRPGSGRKPLPAAERRVKTTISISADTREGMRLLHAAGIKIGRSIDDLVARLLREHNLQIPK